MSLALVPIARRRADCLAVVRRLAHRLLARAAFAVESLAIAVALFEVLVLAVLQGDPILAAHEWGLFLSHYAAASAPARAPVDLALAAVLAALWLFACACRLRSARLIWRIADLEARR